MSDIESFKIQFYKMDYISQKFVLQIFKMLRLYKDVDKNVITLICFTILAIVFHKWWIIFFSLIFWISVEDKEENK